MIRYTCKNCGKSLMQSFCKACGQRAEITEASIFWCSECNIPTYDEVCPICKSRGKRIGSDLRPVFPEERLLLEIILGCPMKYKDASVWNAAGNYYYADGKKIKFTVSQTKNLDADQIRSELAKYKDENQKCYAAFDEIIALFLKANEERYNNINREAVQYIRDTAEAYNDDEMYVSFSGGKDSTVVSSLVMRGLSREDILHLYGDTTLEFPETKDYVNRFKKEHSRTPVLISINKNKDFNELCKQIGPPSRVMRWCCTIFKTGALQRKITSLFRDEKRILTFYGIRRSESSSRSKYDRESDSPKITKQKTVSPIIDWLDFDVWLYLLKNGIDFNNAYRLGYTRVGCWCCPNNSAWSTFLSKIYMPEEYERFRNMLIDFAKKIGKPDPEVYVDDGNWKARQGGNGLEYAQKSVITFEPCATIENTLNFELQRPITEELYELFRPFGWIDKTLGNERLGEVYIVGKDGTLLLKLQGRIGTTTLKVTVLSKKAGRCTSIKAAEEKVKCQITKYQMCMGCLACESICKHGAINMQTDNTGLRSYKISDKKCVRCGECINHFEAGCYMRKVLTIKR